MNKMVRGMSYLLAVNFEAVAVIFGAWMLAKWLDSNHPQQFRWMMVTLPVALLVIAHSFYMVIRALIRLEKGGSSTPEIEKSQKIFSSENKK